MKPLLFTLKNNCVVDMSDYKNLYNKPFSVNGHKIDRKFDTNQSHVFNTHVHRVIPNLVRPRRIELLSESWQDPVLPLNHGRILYYLAKVFLAKSIHKSSLLFKKLPLIIVDPTPKCNFLVLCLP